MMHDVWDYSSDDFAGLVVNYGISNTWRGQGIHNQQWISMPPVTFDSVDGIDVAVIFKSMISKVIQQNIILSHPSEIVLKGIPQNLNDENSTLVQVMALCHHANFDPDLCHHMASLGHNELEVQTHMTWARDAEALTAQGLEITDDWPNHAALGLENDEKLAQWYITFGPENNHKLSQLYHFWVHIINEVYLLSEWNRLKLFCHWLLKNSYSGNII